MPIVIHKNKPAPQSKFQRVTIRSKKTNGTQTSAKEQTTVNETLNRYTLESIIGEGGHGRVFRAFDQLLEMEVAIKVLSPRLVSDPAALAALKSEVRFTLSLYHPNILRIFNLERSGDNYFVVMEYLRGQSFSNLFAESPGGFGCDFVIPALGVLADALDHAHRHGILHKDLTPGNIFLTDDGLLKIIDFGIASAAGIDSSAEGDTIIGTPAYMSPEQLRGDALTAQSDIYSLGVLTHQMLTGRIVNTPNATIEDLAFRPHPPIVDLPPALASVIEKATAFSPTDRFPTAETFASALASASTP